jgi:hypothetical protein
MGERLTCGFVGVAAGGIAGLLAYAGLIGAGSVPLVLLLGLALGAVVGAVATVFVGVARVDKVLGAFALLGLILGGLAGLGSAIAVLVLGGVLPWFLIAAVIGFLIGFLLCGLCNSRRLLATATGSDAGSLTC